MEVLKTLALLFLFTSVASANENSFSFNGFVKSQTFNKKVALFRDSKLVNGSIQLTDSVSGSEGRVVYKQPIKLFEGKGRNLSGSFSSYVSFSMSKEIGSVLGFVMFPSGLDLRLFSKKDNSSSGLGFLLRYKVVAVEFGVSKRGSRVGILVGRVGDVKIGKLSSFSEGFERLNCWIDYEASSKRVEVRLSVDEGVKPVDPFVSYAVDLGKLWRDGSFMVGLASCNGESSVSHYLHSWRFGMRRSSVRAHSQPLDPKEEEKTIKEVGVKGKRKCVWRMFGALVMGAVCGTLGAMLALYLWTVCGNRRSMAIAPEECGDEKSKSGSVVIVDEEGCKK